MMDAFWAVPEWAPAGKSHLSGRYSQVTKIAYGTGSVTIRRSTPIRPMCCAWILFLRRCGLAGARFGEGRVWLSKDSCSTNRRAFCGFGILHRATWIFKEPAERCRPKYITFDDPHEPGGHATHWPVPFRRCRLGRRQMADRNSIWEIWDIYARLGRSLCAQCGISILRAAHFPRDRRLQRRRRRCDTDDPIAGNARGAYGDAEAQGASTREDGLARCELASHVRTDERTRAALRQSRVRASVTPLWRGTTPATGLETCRNPNRLR